MVATEVQFDENHIPLSARSQLNITIANRNDNPALFFYDGLGRDDTIPLTTTDITVTVETNRTGRTTVAKVGAYDIDGSSNFLQLSTSADGGSTAGHVPWLRAFTVPQSLPITWPHGSIRSNFSGSLAFLGANITYQALGGRESDRISVTVRDTGGLFSANSLTINVQIVPSWCQNGGLCAGGPGDPNCTNVTARRENPAGYGCTCLPDYSGTYCEVSLIPVTPAPEPGLSVCQSVCLSTCLFVFLFVCLFFCLFLPKSIFLIFPLVCPNGSPLVQCEHNPCDNASCPSHPDARCVPSYCGRCIAEFFVGTNKVTCSGRFLDCPHSVSSLKVIANSSPSPSPLPPSCLPPPSL